MLHDSSFSLTANAVEKYYINFANYSSESPDFYIRLEDDIPAMRFLSPYDSTILKGIRINNSTIKGGIRVIIYSQYPYGGKEIIEGDEERENGIECRLEEIIAKINEQQNK